MSYLRRALAGASTCLLPRTLADEVSHCRAGKLGRPTVAYLAAQGWEVITVDMKRPPTASLDGKSGLDGALRLVEIDLQDMGQVLETFMEIDMVSCALSTPCGVHEADVTGSIGLQGYRRRRTPRCHPLPWSNLVLEPVPHQHHVDLQRPRSVSQVVHP